MKLNIKTFIVTLAASLVVSAVADNEIAISAILKADKTDRHVLRSPGTRAITWIGSRYYGPVTFTATETYSALAKGAVANNGYVFMHNVSTAGVAIVSFNGGTNDHLRLKAGEFALMRFVTNMPIASVMVKCSTTNDFEFTILED
jgi:hypothetical protein